MTVETAGQRMELKIVTGMSGAGKTQAVQALEDMGYYCVDNLPPNLFSKFVELVNQSHSDLQKVALVADVRGGRFFLDLIDILSDLRAGGVEFQVIFLEAGDEVLVRRFKETRRKHPLSSTGSVLSGIKEERKRLQPIRGMADVIIDTSNMKTSELKGHILDLSSSSSLRLSVSIFSFGFKYGMPIDADLVMDVRFLPNPYYIPELKNQTGENEAVSDYVLNKPVTQTFLTKYSELLLEILPKYIEEGKRHLAVAIGCTGGQHRSVAIAIELGRLLQAAKDSGKHELGGVEFAVSHRDIEQARIKTKYQPLDD